MSDQHMRELERQALAGCPEAALRLAAASSRTGRCPEAVWSDVKTRQVRRRVVHAGPWEPIPCEDALGVADGWLFQPSPTHERCAACGAPRRIARIRFNWFGHLVSSKHCMRIFTS